MLRTFRSSESGNVAVLFAFALLPLAAAAGAAVDYSRAASLKAALQSAADSTALAQIMAAYKDKSIDPNAFFTKEFSPGVAYENLDVSGTWTVPGRIYRVAATANTPTTFMSLLVPKMDIGVVASAELLNTVSIKPVTAMMEPEASDYNELRFYCYRPPQRRGESGKRLGPIDVKTGLRVDPVKFADNSPAGLAAGASDNPEALERYACGAGENVSYQMHNIRDARTMSNPYSRPSKYHYDYYTDTTYEDGKIKFNTNPADIIETIYCDTKEQCTKTKSQGGLIPDRKTNRAPLVNTKPCTDGFMYMGWEDRQTTGDRDYDDIRIVMSCEDPNTQHQMKARLTE